MIVLEHGERVVDRAERSGERRLNRVLLAVERPVAERGIDDGSGVVAISFFSFFHRLSASRLLESPLEE